MLTLEQQERLRAAFKQGTLKVRSLSPVGQPEWKRVVHVHRAEVGPETILRVTTHQGSSVLTGGHRVFVTPTSKVEAEQLATGSTVAGVESAVSVLGVERLPSRQYMYDLTAEDWHNFVLYRSGMVVSNSPDRNYHFRPPTHEETVRQFNRVFGYIWLDEELKEYLEQSMHSIALYPPFTPFQNLDHLASQFPSWRSVLLSGAMYWALNAVRINWVADEFDYSIGGISLTIDKASKYESAAQSASDQFDKQIEKAKATVNVIRGLQQPRYGIGIRSSFGPYVGRGVLSPRKFVGL